MQSFGTRARGFAARTVEPVAGPAFAIPDATRYVHLQLRRYAGCPVCNLHLRSIARRHAELLEAGIVEVVVFHSAPAKTLDLEGFLPFAVIADPHRRLYDEWAVGTMGARHALHPRSWRAAWRALTGAPDLRGATGRGEQHRGIPAELLIAPDGSIVASHHGRFVDDHWSVDELLEHAAAARRTSNQDDA